MTFCVEKETDFELSLPYEEIFRAVALQALEQEGCPYEAEINLLITDNASIREMNREYRGIDSVTDVLSFPMADYDTPADFSGLEKDSLDYFHPETGELLLGDIIISAERASEQAEKYGHSLKREFAFLIAHSMLHLFGYDHMTEEEAKVMEEKQEKILSSLAITR